MTELRIPPDGVIAARFAELADNLRNGERRYFRDAILSVIRERAPASDSETLRKCRLTPVQAVALRERAWGLADQIERIRAGEERLPSKPVQEALDI